MGSDSLYIAFVDISPTNEVENEVRFKVWTPFFKYYFSDHHLFHGKDELQFLFQLVMQNVKTAGEQIQITFEEDENDTTEADKANVDIIETSFDHDGSGSGEHTSGDSIRAQRRYDGLMLPNTRQIQPFHSNMVIIGTRRLIKTSEILLVTIFVNPT